MSYYLKTKGYRVYDPVDYLDYEEPYDRYESTSRDLFEGEDENGEEIEEPYSYIPAALESLFLAIGRQYAEQYGPYISPKQNP